VANDGGCTLQNIFFDFDSETLQPAARDVLQQNADCLRKRGSKTVRLIGYTDPRGTEEYNLALGDRRAKSVGTYLKSLGSTIQSVSTTSMGEEMAKGTDEVSWAQDRKVEFEAQ